MQKVAKFQFDSTTQHHTEMKQIRQKKLRNRMPTRSRFIKTCKYSSILTDSISEPRAPASRTHTCGSAPPILLNTEIYCPRRHQAARSRPHRLSRRAGSCCHRAVTCGRLPLLSAAAHTGSSASKHTCPSGDACGTVQNSSVTSGSKSIHQHADAATALQSVDLVRW